MPGAPMDLHMRARELMRAWFRTYPGLKVLRVAPQVSRLLSLVLSVSELALDNVHMVAPFGQLLGDAVSNVHVYVLASPDPECISSVCAMLRDGKRRQPHHIGLTAPAGRDVLEQLAVADTHHLVHSVHVLNTHFYAVSAYACHAGVAEPGSALLRRVRLRALNLHSVGTDEAVSHIVHGLCSLAAAHGWALPPCVRYATRSSAARLVAQHLATLQRPAQPSEPTPTVIIIERADDPIAPLVLPWTYHAILQEHYDVRDDRYVHTHTPEPAAVTVPGPAAAAAGGHDRTVKAALRLARQAAAPPAPGRTPGPDTPEPMLVLARDFDAYFVQFEHLDYATYIKRIPPILAGLKRREDEARAAITAGADTEPSRIRSTILTLPDLVRRRRIVGAHLQVATEVADHVRNANLITVSRQLQALAAEQAQGEAEQGMLALLRSASTSAAEPAAVPDDILRLYALYALRYEATPNKAFESQLRAAASALHPDLAAALLTVQRAVCAYAGDERRTTDVFHNRNLGGLGRHLLRITRLADSSPAEPQGTSSHMRYTPLAAVLAREHRASMGAAAERTGTAASRTLTEQDFPARGMQHAGAPLVVIVLGGITLLEAHHFYKINQEPLPGMHTLTAPAYLLSTSIINAHDFIVDACQY